MIRHRPYGRGHPYLFEPDQRVPAQVVAGEQLELRASTDRLVRRVLVEFADERPPLEAHLRGRAAADEITDYSSPAPHRRSASHQSRAPTDDALSGRLSWAATLDRVDDRFRYRFVAEKTDSLSRTRWFEALPAQWTQGAGTLSVVGGSGGEADLVNAAEVNWLVADETIRRVRLPLRLRPRDRVVGFGERFDSLDQRGKRLDSVVFEQYKGQGGRTYLPMPYAIVIGDGESWGFYIETSRRVWFDVGATDPEQLWIEVDLDCAQPAELRLHVFSGSPHEILVQFLDLTQPPKLPPAWIFEPWMSSNEWNTQARVLAEIERGETLGIPAGVIVIEAWSDESTFVAFRDAEYEPHADGAPHRLRDFTFRPDGAWPDPKGLVDQLHGRGMRVLLWQVPLLKTAPPPQGQARIDRDVLIERRFAVRTEAGRPYRNRSWWFPGALLPDWTNAEASEWWLAKRRYLLEEVGIDGFKTDGGEHAWGSDLRYADGTDGGTSNNLYPIMYAAAYHDFYQQLGREAVTFSRAGFTGAGGYPCHWAGDEDSTWEAFRASVTAGLTAGACGVFFWGWDLAGFSGEIPSAELYLRAAAMACFTPIMQYHSEYNYHRRPSNDRTPWNIAARTGDRRVIPIFRRFAQLRQRLVPYLAEQARESVSARKPLMRALFFDWPDDAVIWEYPHQYMLGDDLLVSPVLAPGEVEPCVYLPAGAWLDAWHGELLNGPTQVSRLTPLDEIPVYVRAAACELTKLFAPVLRSGGHRDVACDIPTH